MVSLLENYVNRVEYDSYEDFKENFKILVPDNFNFAYDIVDKYAEIVPDKKALVWCNDHGEEHIFTFADIKRNSDKVANFLKSVGIGEGDAVLLTLKSRFEFWFTTLALHKLHAISIPATHMLKTHDITYRMKNAHIKAVFTIDEDNLLSNYEEAEAELIEGGELDGPIPKIVVDGPERDGWYHFNTEFEKASSVLEKPEPNDNEDIMLVYFSSGTTGMPKMISHCYSYPLGHILTAKYWQQVMDDGLHYTVADTGWAKSSWGQIYGQWISGTALFIYDYDRFNAHNMIENAMKYGVTTFCAPPTIYRFLIKEDLSAYDFSGWEHASTAGEPLNPEVFYRFKDITGLEIREGFGQTETVVCAANFPWIEPNPGSMGKPSPGFNITLRNSDDQEVDYGREGEICIDVDPEIPTGLFRGYYLNDEKTREVWYDGRYHMGDTAWLDEKDHLWFIGRVDDVIKSSGYRIGPFEVESAVLTHPSVIECAVTAYPDDVRGQVVKASIILTKDYEASDELKKDIQDHVKKVTAPYKYPRCIEFVEELPKTLGGKIKRRLIHAEDMKKYNEKNNL